MLTRTPEARWAAIHADADQFLAHVSRPLRLLDVGCYTGVITALAARDGCTAVGLDADADAIDAARAEHQVKGTKHASPQAFVHADILDGPAMSPYEDVPGIVVTDVTLLLSVWPYLAQVNVARAEAALGLLVENTRALYFEAQLVGDGPGTFEDDLLVYQFLRRYGPVSNIITLPVTGRESTTRTIWRVQGGRYEPPIRRRRAATGEFRLR